MSAFTSLQIIPRLFYNVPHSTFDDLETKASSLSVGLNIDRTIFGALASTEFQLFTKKAKSHEMRGVFEKKGVLILPNETDFV